MSFFSSRIPSHLIFTSPWAPLGCDGFSHLPCFWWAGQFSVLVRYFVELLSWDSPGVFLLVSVGLWVWGRKIPEVKALLITPGQGYMLSRWLVPVDVVLFGRKHCRQPTLRERWVNAPPSRGSCTYTQYLQFFHGGDISLLPHFFPSLFNHLFILAWIWG